jgi:hypothetical protein
MNEVSDPKLGLHSVQSGLTPELSRAAQWRKLCASVAQAQR